MELWTVYDRPPEHPEKVAVRKVLVAEDGLCPAAGSSRCRAPSRTIRPSSKSGSSPLLLARPEERAPHDGLRRVLLFLRHDGAENENAGLRAHVARRRGAAVAEAFGIWDRLVGHFVQIVQNAPLSRVTQ